MNEKAISLKKNFIYNMVYQVLILIVPLITTPYVSRVLGAENVGIYNFVTANVSYFTLIAAFGSASYAQREIAIARSSKEKLSEEFWGIFAFRFLSTFVASVIFGFFLLLNPQYKIYYIVNIISIISVAFDISWFFQGLENFKVTVFRNALIKLISTGLIFFFVKHPDDLIIYFLINVLSVFLGNVSLWHFLKGKIDRPSFQLLNIKKHLYGSVKLFIPFIAIQVYTVVDKTMLGALTDVAEVGYYSQSEKIVQLILTVTNSLAIVLLPRISVLIANNDYTHANMFYKKSVRFSMLLSLPCMAGCIMVADDFVPLFLGSEYLPSINVLRVLSLLFIVLGLARIIGTPLLIPLKREGKYTLSVCAGALINVLLNSILIIKYNALGAAIATIVAETTVTSLEIYFIGDYFEAKEIFRSFIHYAVPTIIMTGTVWLVRLIMSPGVIRLIISVICGGMVYLGALLFEKDDLLNNYVIAPLKKIVLNR